MRALERRSKWQLRALIGIERCTTLITWALLVWVVYAVMQTVIWPSRSCLLELSALIVTAWVLVGFAAPGARPLAAASGDMGSVDLRHSQFLNLTGSVAQFLDRSAMVFGDLGLSALAVLKAPGARYVSITTHDRKGYLIPNEDLITNQVVNCSPSNDFVRLDIHFGTAYANDPHQVRRAAIAAASGVGRVLADQRAVCHIVVCLALWDAFRDNDITIPFPQREVTLLPGSAPTTAPAAE